MAEPEMSREAPAEASKGAVSKLTPISTWIGMEGCSW